MKLEELKKKTKEFKKLIEKEYPHKRISEYTRLVDQLDELLAYGAWELAEKDS